MKEYKFPKGFLWGAATSAHQIEGNNHNDWSEWEQSEKRVGELKLRGLDPRDFVSGKACDSYNRYEEDLDIAKSLNHNVHRFSIEWSRIEPEKGKFNDEEMRHYKTLIGAIRSRGMEPMVTLWHFTNPIWFSQEGGFLNKKATHYFTRYVKYVVDNLKDDVHLWITFNEALTVYAGYTKLSATWPSRDKGVFNFFKIRQNITKCHVGAYKVIKKICGGSPTGSGSFEVEPLKTLEVRPQGPREADVSHNVSVGITENNVYIPDTKNFWTTWARRLYKRLRNFYFFRDNIPYYDFIGLNYYHISRKPKFAEKKELVPQQEFMKEMKWEIYPEGIYHVLNDLKKFKKPIYITENGIADRTDLKREKFIKDHLFWIHKAISEGVDVRGYMYWSLLDNFEWAEGYAPSFGLVEVNYDTMERKIRPSALKYAEICKSNTLKIDE